MNKSINSCKKTAFINKNNNKSQNYAGVFTCYKLIYCKMTDITINYLYLLKVQSIIAVTNAMVKTFCGKIQCH